MSLHSVACLALAAVAASAFSVDRPRVALSAPSQMNEIIPGQVLVRFSQAQAQAIASNPISRMAAADGALAEARFRSRIGSTGWTVWLVDPRTDTRQYAKALMRMPGVSYAQPVNRVYPLLGPPNDPDWGELEMDNEPPIFLFGDPGQFYRLWHLQDTFLLDQFTGTTGAFANYPNRWYDAATRPRKPRMIGFVDTGVDLGHPDFANTGNPSTNLAQGGQIDLARSKFWQFGEIDPTGTANDAHGHGTHVMGLAVAAGNNGGFDSHGVIGSGYPAAGIMQRVFDDQGVGTDTDASSAIFYLADQGCDVINISLGTENFSQIFQDAVTYAYQKGSLVVVAGNEDGGGGGDLGPIYPAACSGALGVTANGPDLIPAMATYAGMGYYVDVAAPGGDLVQIGDPTDPENFWLYIQFVWSTAMRTAGTAHNNPNLFPPYELNYAYLAGTSMACPIVSGAAALYMDKQRLTQKSPWGNLRAYRAIERSAIGAGAPNGGWEAVQGFGSLDAEALLLEQNARGALIGGVEGIVYLNEIATQNIQIRARRLVGGVPTGPTFSTTSKPDGTYRFDGMPEGEYDVWTQGGGVPSKHKVAKVVNGSDQTGFDFWIGAVFFDSTLPQGFIEVLAPGLSTTQVIVNNFANDTETGVDRIRFKMGTAPDGSDAIAEQDLVVGVNTRTISGLNLNANTVYFITYEIWNGANMLRKSTYKWRVIP